MAMIFLLAAGSPGVVPAQTPTGPFLMSTNFAADLLGPLDIRPETWGCADATQWTVTFSPPVGYSVRVIAIHGDLISWIKTIPGTNPPPPATPPESSAGVLVSIQTTDPVNSGRCDLCADVAHLRRGLAASDMTGNEKATAVTMLYVQDGVSKEMPKSRAAFDRNNLNVVLRHDNKLVVTVAAWLNTTGKPIHIEPTFTMKYEWVGN